LKIKGLSWKGLAGLKEVAKKWRKEVRNVGATIQRQKFSTVI